MPPEPQTEPSRDPRAAYAQRLEARRAEVARLSEQDRKIAGWRGAVVVAGIVLIGLALGVRGFFPWWLLLPTALFFGLAVRHERVLASLRRARRAAAYYEAGLRRVEERWAGHGEPGERYLDPHHPYARDLDLFGRGSLFERLCTARTRAGEETLAGWLLSPAPSEAVRARQEAVQDLRRRLDFREELFLIAEDVRSAVDADALAAWGGAEAVRFSPGERWMALAFTAATVAGAAWWALGNGALLFLILLLTEQAFALTLSKRVWAVTRSVEGPARHLALFAPLLERLEREAFDAPLLADLKRALETEGEPPSRRLARLQRLIELLDARRNMLFGPVAAVLLWPVHLAFRIEDWRQASGPQVARWLTLTGEMEAVASLSAYAFERPEDPFPEVRDSGCLFEAEGLGHPLLPDERSVRNDLALDEHLRLVLVSGSNMSGKSTFLRSVGTNAVLALAGAPVRARRLRMAPVVLGASLVVQDSLQEGASRFYAEITRLRQVVDLAGGEVPLLFLLDEILHGTNSHDRRIGAEAVVRTLVRRGALGLVTTHDLALTRIAEDPELRAINVHFQDTLEAGKMSFDYRLHPGVVTRSNALELMRAVGLDV